MAWREERPYSFLLLLSPFSFFLFKEPSLSSFLLVHIAQTLGFIVHSPHCRGQRPLCPGHSAVYIHRRRLVSVVLVQNLHHTKSRRRIFPSAHWRSKDRGIGHSSEKSWFPRAVSVMNVWQVDFFSTRALPFIERLPVSARTLRRI